MRRLWRILLIIAGVFAVFMIYRVGIVYKFRPGTCTPPKPRTTPAKVVGPQTLRVMTYNIEGHAQMIHSDHLAKIADVIRQQHPDIVGLNEVHRHTWQSRFEDQVHELEQLTGMRAVYGPSFRALGGEFGNAILTRVPVRATELVPLPGTGEPRTLLGATVETNGGTVDFYVTHTTAWGRLNASTRHDQMACVATLTGNDPFPFIVVGDMNADPEAVEIREFLASSGTSIAGGKLGATQKLMDEQIDHIFISRGWNVAAASVPDVGPSDHRPVVVDLAWKGTR